MASTERVAEDVRHMKDVSRKNQSTWRKVTQMKLNAQSVKKTTPVFSKFFGVYKREGGILEKYKRDVTFFKGSTLT